MTSKPSEPTKPSESCVFMTLYGISATNITSDIHKCNVTLISYSTCATLQLCSFKAEEIG